MSTLLERLTEAQNAHDVDPRSLPGVTDFRAELLASCRDRDVEWGEVYWHGHHSDSSVFAMSGVVIATIRGEQIAEARIYVEPVAAAQEDIDAAVERLYQPPLQS